jgi:1-hydroxy-2-methyl-2-(E)-butenyl 4-diphosphate synthase
MTERRKTRRVMVGSVPIGGDSPVSIQSMTSVPMEDAKATIAQIGRLAAAGADIVRVAVRNLEAAGRLGEIIAASPVPVAADIHFDHRVALAAIRAGARKIRLNPGNIGGPEKVREVVAAAMDAGVPVRIGVNAGSLDRKRFPHPTPENMVQSAMEHLRILEAEGFTDIIVSLKSSDVQLTVEANRLFSRACDYPLHLGLTEAGYGTVCIVNSSVAIGTLLMEGIGDTVRVSMTGDPAEEIPVAREDTGGLRRAAGLRADHLLPHLRPHRPGPGPALPGQGDRGDRQETPRGGTEIVGALDHGGGDGLRGERAGRGHGGGRGGRRRTRWFHAPLLPRRKDTEDPAERGPGCCVGGGGADSGCEGGFTGGGFTEGGFTGGGFTGGGFTEGGFTGGGFTEGGLTVSGGVSRG